MTFGEKLKYLRTKEGMTQEQLGKAIGAPKRSVANYEMGCSFPRDVSIYNRIAERFNVTVDYLLSEQEEFTAKAYAEGGSKGKRKAETVIAEVSALFAGSEISETDKESAFMVLQEAYWKAKHENKKYAPKQRSKKS